MESAVISLVVIHLAANLKVLDLIPMTGRDKLGFMDRERDGSSRLSRLSRKLVCYRHGNKHIIQMTCHMHLSTKAMMIQDPSIATHWASVGQLFYSAGASTGGGFGSNLLPSGLRGGE